MSRTHYREIEVGRGFQLLLLLFGTLAAGGLFSAWCMEEHGHIVTGMSNQIVWGLPHVFAITLIVAASGALNVASMASVFGRTRYKPLARVSGLLAIALLAGGLAVLVLDLGRPERLVVAMTTYNFRSIFAWNIFLYSGFAAIVAAYLYVQMARGFERYVGGAGLLAFLWRLVLTTGTGSIFGFLVARRAYDAAIMAPLFIAMSLALGQAVFLLVIMPVCAGSGRPIGMDLLNRLARLLGIFAAVTLYFTVVQHLANLYAAKGLPVERFILLEGGIYTVLFWVGYVGLGALLPIGLVFSSLATRSRRMIALAALATVLGSLALLYVIVIGGQAFPLALFPGMEVSSTFQDGIIAAYRPSLPELGLGLGGVAMAVLVVMFGVRLFPFVPMSLAEEAIDLQIGKPAGEGALAT